MSIVAFPEPRIYMPNGVEFKTGRYAGPRFEVIRETREPDPTVQSMINRSLGLNIFGEPMYRLIWGQNRLDWVAGAISRFDSRGNYLREDYGVFLEPKYSYLGEGINRWMVEKWVPPEMYGTREQWEAETSEIEGFQDAQALGPYPSRGDYELSTVIQDIDQSYLPLNHTVVMTAIEMCEFGRRQDRARLAAYKRDLEEKKQKAFEQEAGDMFDDAAPAFGGTPNSFQSNAPMHNTKSEIRDVSRREGPFSKGMGIFDPAS